MGYQGLAATLEDDAVLTDMNARYKGDYLNETSFLAAARARGFSTAAVGKLGPTSIQDVTRRDGSGTIVIDDSTGLAAPDGVGLAPDVAAAMKAAGLVTTAPDRGLNGSSGALNMAGPLVANVEQQDWFTRAAARRRWPRG